MPRKGDSRPLGDRFWEKVKKTETCWLWAGGRFGAGRGERHRYGCFMVSRKEGTRLAHRVSWTLAHGKIPSGLQVCHTCDIPICVNPAHLYIGTQKDNARDMATRKRNFVRRGEASHFAKLTRAQALSIRNMHATRTGPVRDLIEEAKKMGIGKSQFYNIVSGKHWA